MEFDDFQWMELCEALGLPSQGVRDFEVVEAVKTVLAKHERLLSFYGLDEDDADELIANIDEMIANDIEVNTCT